MKSGSTSHTNIINFRVRRRLEFSNHAMNNHVAEMKIREFALASNVNLNDIIEEEFPDIEEEDSE